MAGSGQRFVDQGYKDPKPLIRIGSDNRRIIEHVLDMFDPCQDEIVFVCNALHLLNTDMRSVLTDLVPGCQIVGMAPHKLGPVHTIMAAFSHIKDDEPVIVSYCDGTLRWDREAFLEHAKNMDGCLFTHTGFHPHVLSSTKMAYIKEENGRVLEVKEKASYTGNPLAEHASSGVYYFRRGDQLKHYSYQLVTDNISHNGEFYVTLLYNLFIQAGLNIGYYDTDLVAILGTPEEVRNFEAWATITRNPHLKDFADLVKTYSYWKRFWN